MGGARSRACPAAWRPTRPEPCDPRPSRLPPQGHPKLERPPEDRLMWLLPTDAVRADHMIDSVVQSEAPQVLPDLFVAAPERVRDEPDDEAVALRPAERLGSARHQLRHEVERHAAGGAQPIHGHIVKTVPAVGEPFLNPAI